MILWVIAATVSYAIKGLCGFANTLVFTTIMSFGTANANISPIDLLMGYPANVVLAWNNRKSLDPKVYVPLSALVLAGSIPGALLLKNVDVRAIKLVFGVVVVLLGAEMLSQEYRKQQARASKILLALIGVAGGALCGLFGVGALLAAYVSRVTDNTAAFKAFRIILYSALHLLTLDTVKMALILAPFVLLWVFLGMKCSRRMDEKLVRKLMSVLLVLSGLSLILKNL